VRLGRVAGEHLPPPLDEVRLALVPSAPRALERIRVEVVRRQGSNEGRPLIAHATPKLASEGNEVVPHVVVFRLGVLVPLLLRGITSKSQPPLGRPGEVRNAERIGEGDVKEGGFLVKVVEDDVRAPRSDPPPGPR